jgi:MFS family permease
MVWGAGMVLGGLSGGWVADKIGQRQAMAAGVVFGSIGMALFAVIPGAGWAWGLMLVFGLTFGLYETAFFATGMYLTDPRIAASMFALLMAIANIGTGIGFGVAGWLVDLTGFRPTFGILAAFNLLILLLLPLIYNNIKSGAQSSHSAGT